VPYETNDVQTQMPRNGFELATPAAISHVDIRESISSQASSQSQSHIATDGHSVSKSWCRAPSGTHDQIFSCYYLKVTVLFLWCALPDERTDLSFVYAAGSSQRSLSRVRVLATRDSTLELVSSNISGYQLQRDLGVNNVKLPFVVFEIR
jgi:hypothetical protein